MSPSVGGGVGFWVARSYTPIITNYKGHEKVPALHAGVVLRGAEQVLSVDVRDGERTRQGLVGAPDKQALVLRGLRMPGDRRVAFWGDLPGRRDVASLDQQRCYASTTSTERPGLARTDELREQLKGLPRVQIARLVVFYYVDHADHDAFLCGSPAAMGGGFRSPPNHQ